jgi:hypothetical protein
MSKTGTWLYAAALRASPAKAWLGATVVGIVMVLISGMLGLNEKLGDAHAGYFDALNWSFGFTVLFPVALLGTLSAVGAMEPLVADLENRRMLVDQAWRSQAAEPFLDSWRARASSYGAWTCGLAVSAIAWCGWEWWTLSGTHLWHGQLTSPVPRDWAVATVVQNRGVVARAGNAVFSFVAIVGMQGLLAFCALGLLCFMVAVTDFVLSHSLSPRPAHEAPAGRLVPSVVASGDPRCGFQAFEGILLMVLLASGSLFTMAYGSVVWNAFLRSDRHTMLEFVQRDMIGGFGASGASWLGGLFGSGEPAAEGAVAGSAAPALQITPPNHAAAIGAYVLLAAVVCVIPVVLRYAAMRSRESVLVLLEGERLPADSWIEGEDTSEVRTRLKAMQFWPMRYVSLTQLFLAVAFGWICLVWYRFGLIYLGLLVGVVVTKIWIATKAKKAGPAEP